MLQAGQGAAATCTAAAAAAVCPHDLRRPLRLAAQGCRSCLHALALHVAAVCGVAGQWRFLHGCKQSK